MKIKNIRTTKIEAVKVRIQTDKGEFSAYRVNHGVWLSDELERIDEYEDKLEMLYLEDFK